VIIDYRLHNVAQIIGRIEIEYYGSVVHKITGKPERENGVTDFAVRLQWTIFQRFPKTMKLLLTADLHFRSHWFRWLIKQAANYDLVCIASDLLDMSKSETRSGGNSCGLSARLFCFWSRSCISLRVWPKLEPEIGRVDLAGTGRIAESAISESYQAGTESGESSWHTTGETWIPKEGLYDHLVLKLTKD
jgi:hypothetical protein